MPNLFDVLLHFRCHQTALTSDIEKAFQQVAIALEHRDLLSFLWVLDVNEAHCKIVIRSITRAFFGVTSSPSYWKVPFNIISPNMKKKIPK